MPIMVRSKACHLAELKETDLAEVGECPFDQGGYFLINGAERVLIAQVRGSVGIVEVEAGGG